MLTTLKLVKEYRSFFANPNYKITRDQRLVKSVLEHCLKQRGAAGFDPETIYKLQENMDFRRRYRFYLRVKRMIPISCVSPFTLAELNKMSIATILGSPSLPLTVSAFIGFGLPFCLISEVTDQLTADIEESITGQEIPIDISNTGGTIPPKLGDIREILDSMKEFGKDLPDMLKDQKHKTY